MHAPLRLQRATRVFLASLIVTYGASAPEVLRQMADELDDLAAEIGSPDPRACPPESDADDA